MPSITTIPGEVFGKWTVLSEAERWPNKPKCRRYLCRCECGREKIVWGYHIRNNKSKSCPNCRIKRHGMTYTSTHAIWRGILSRCSNPKNQSYQWYGGRGIKVCNEWLVFENFYADMGDRPEGLSIDRINNDGNYEKSNCRWATIQEQAQNRRSKWRIR